MIWRLIRWPVWTLVAMLLAYQLYLFVSIAWMANHNPTSTAFIKAERDRLALMKPPVPIRQIWVPYRSIATSVKQAVIAAEDSGFSRHDGGDWEAMEKAARENFKKGKIRRGGSTITMQLAKNLFLSSERSYLRKAQELIITGMLEAALDKRRILEIYLNVAEWGVGVFGIEAASRHYFGISAQEVSPEQAAWLASILPAPRRFDRNRESAWILEKSLVILDRMPRVAIPK
jgi:monofunctional biosynthetic peptidoglycan transglycosylase